MPADAEARSAASLARVLATAYRAFDARARRRIAALLALTVVGALLEALGAAVIVPFIALISDPSYLQTNAALASLHQRTGALPQDSFIVASALALFGFFIAKNLYLAAMANAQFRFIYDEMPRYSSELFARYMRRPYSEHKATNTAELLRNVSNEVLMYFTNFLIPALTLTTEALVLVAIVGVLLLIAPLPTLAAIVLLGGLTRVFYGLVRARVRRFGQQQQRENTERIKWVNQGLGAIKEVKLLGREQYFVDRFRHHEECFSQSARYAMVLNQTPRLFIETISFAALFLGVAVALSLGESRLAVLPVLALFAVASVRLLPSLNRILLSITRMAYYRPAAEVVLQARRQPVAAAVEPAPAAPPKGLGDWRELTFDAVSYAYPGRLPVLHGVSLVIPRGTSVALIGPSGSGKTTMADLALGLLKPTSGHIRLDGQDIQPFVREWQNHLGYIPQTIYLLDDTVRRNVALGLPDDAIDDGRVWNALRQARLDDFVRSLPGQLDACVGENGGRLSGGQRQRLGIARALYGEPDVLVLDEATSALDEATEREIADTLDSLAGRQTLLVIAHRPETINRCHQKYSLAAAALREINPEPAGGAAA